MRRLVVKWTVWLLKNKYLSLKERSVLLTAILDKLDALPLYDIIQVNESDGSIVVNGKSLDLEEMKLVRESAVAALNSRAEKLIEDQVIYESYTYGTNTAVNLDQLFFAKAAIWWGKRRHEHLKTLANLGAAEDSDL